MSIKAMREKLEITQEELARRLGVERSTVAKWESGVAFPRRDRMLKVAKILKCDINALLRSQM